MKITARGPSSVMLTAFNASRESNPPSGISLLDHASGCLHGRLPELPMPACSPRRILRCLTWSYGAGPYSQSMRACAPCRQ